MRESTIEQWYCSELKRRNVHNVKLGKNGWPDRMFLANGSVMFVEFKAPGKHIDKKGKQEYWRKRLQGEGFVVLEISYKSDAIVETIATELLEGDYIETNAE